MAYYAAPFNFNFGNSIVDVDPGIVDVDCQTLYTAIKAAQASEEGILYERIGSGSGLSQLGPGVQVGLTVELLGAWQLRFAEGNYIARVAGGNLIGGLGGDPIAYSAGVQTLLIQSAASTVVTEGGSIGAAVQSAMTAQGFTPDRASQIDEMHTMRGLKQQNPLTVTPSGETAGSISLTFTGDGKTSTTVTRQ